jgi:ABC-type phosphate/phosphonate transport system substrate-binding protein
MATSIVFGACRLDAYAKTRFAELCHAASRQTQLQIVPRHVAHYEDLTTILRTVPQSLVWAPPIVAAQMLDAGVGEVLALPERHGLLTSNVAFIVRLQDAASTLADLKGRRVMWLDRQSASGYVIPRMHLASHGYDPASFFAAETFGETHLSVLDAVSSGVVDVGTSWCRVDPKTNKLLDAGWIRSDGMSIRPVRAAHTIGPVPNDAILVSPMVHVTERIRLVRWLLEPEKTCDQPLRELMSTRVFRTPIPAHFIALREMLHATASAAKIP